MAYCKVEGSFIYAPSDDYAVPVDDVPVWLPYKPTGLTMRQFRKGRATTGSGLVLTLTAFTSIKLFAVKNLDPANFVTLGWTHSGTGPTVGKSVILPGGYCLLNFVLSSYTAGLVADTASCPVEVFIAGT